MTTLTQEQKSVNILQLLKEHPLLSILCLAVLARVIVYVLANWVLYEGQIQHPDSYFYHYTAIELAEFWKQGTFTFSNYPIYSNFLAPFYLIKSTVGWGELFNFIFSLGIVYLLFTTLRDLVSLRTGVIGAVIAAVDPYTVYLSTQLLRDVPLLFFMVAAVCASLKFGKAIGVPYLFVILLRGLQAYSLLPLLLYTYRRKKYILVLLVVLSLLPLTFDYLPGSQSFLHNISLAPTKATDEGSHIPFFYPTSSAAIPPYEFYKHMVTLINPYTHLYAFYEFLTYPKPWRATYSVEYAFAVNALFWYGVFFLGAYGLLACSKIRKDILFLTLWAIFLGILLTISQDTHSAFVRWRVQIYYLLVPILSIGLMYLSYYEGRKRAFDVLVASILLVITSPIIVVVIVLLKMKCGSIIFRQKRVGYNGRIFTIYKFITMYKNSDGRPVKDLSDSRITPLGRILRRFYLDEIPQLWNILKGDMSLIGPRPLAVWEDRECAILYKNWGLRYLTTPGILGLAQLTTLRHANGPKLIKDLEYYKSQNDLYDLKIFLKTGGKFFLGGFYDKAKNS